MIVSHRYKFVFIKTTKTAGTSVEIALSKFCGPGDIVTPISPADEELRRRIGHPGPQNCFASAVDYSIRDLGRLLVRSRRKLKFYNHMSARQLKPLVGERVWRDYYKFCFDRSPWDRVVSFYYWKHKTEPRPSLAEFVRSAALEELKEGGFGLYSIAGRVVVDRVCLYENLSGELERFAQTVGIPDVINLPRAKSSFRRDKRHYRELLGDEEQRIISDAFAEEIGLCGYEY